MMITGMDRIIDQNNNLGLVITVVHDIATVLPDYASGDLGYCYVMHVSRLDRIDSETSIISNTLPCHFE